MHQEFVLKMISLRMAGHAEHSGYHLCSEGLDEDPLVVTNDLPLFGRTIARAMRSLVRHSGSTWYHRSSLWGELRVARRWLTRQRQIFHFLYGENLYRHAGMLKRISPRNVLVATYHTPTWRMQELVHDRAHLNHLDGIVVMARCQMDFFREVAPQAQVHFVPHGIDTDFYRPAAKPTNDPMRVISVGLHLRDFEVIAAVARVLAERGAEIEFLVVCNPERAGAVANIPNVRLVSGLSDEALREAYQDSTALYLPLLDSTANNSLLEALACGLPIISTDLPGVRDYTNSDCAVLTEPKSVEASLAAVEALLDGRYDLPAMALASRKMAENLSWSATGEQLKSVYRQLA